MPGSVRDMQVTFAAPAVIPPTGGWWQSWYVLAFLSTGVLVGVAMFAQRQRWRPAKAFLVDENGRMLREFTLDPSCQVTYDQAVQAGGPATGAETVYGAKDPWLTGRRGDPSLILLTYRPN